MPTITGGNTVWTTWVSGTSTGTSCTATTVWGNWVSAGTNTSTTLHFTYADAVWGNWASTYVPQPQRALTDEERAARDERDAQYRREQAAQAAHRAEERRKTEEEQRQARATAEVLLLEHLSEEQAAEYQRDRSFRVISADGERVYRVKRGWSGNVELIRPDGRVASRFCIHPREWVPEEDNMLAQKLLLETDEAAFLRIANATRFAA